MNTHVTHKDKQAANKTKPFVKIITNSFSLTNIFRSLIIVLQSQDWDLLFNG
jgi:hypothetical protein